MPEMKRSRHHTPDEKLYQTAKNRSGGSHTSRSINKITLFAFLKKLTLWLFSKCTGFFLSKTAEIYIRITTKWLNQMKNSLDQLNI